MLAQVKYSIQIYKIKKLNLSFPTAQISVIDTCDIRYN